MAAVCPFFICPPSFTLYFSIVPEYSECKAIISALSVYMPLVFFTVGILPKNDHKINAPKSKAMPIIPSLGSGEVIAAALSRFSGLYILFIAFCLYIPFINKLFILSEIFHIYK